MFDDMIEWFKGIFGSAAEEATQGVSDTLGGGLDTAQESAQSFGEDTFGGAAEAAQGYGEEALGGATEAAQGYGEDVAGGAAESVQGFQDQADAVGGMVEDPGGAAADAARDQFGRG